MPGVCAVVTREALLRLRFLAVFGRFALMAQDAMVPNERFALTGMAGSSHCQFLVMELSHRSQ